MKNLLNLQNVNDIINETTNNAVITKTYKQSLEQEGVCSWCGPHNGCNAKAGKKRNWKRYRKHQFKNAVPSFRNTQFSDNLEGLEFEQD